jgi:ATP-dependent exoDNAse (exonuclease V) beta subunit
LTDEGEPDAEGEPDPGLQKRPRDLDLPPWLKGRYGTAVGRAVHGVLQTIDLSSGAGLDEALAAQCEAEAVPDRAEEVRTLVLQALGSASVVEAASSPHWREVYACTPHEGRLLEGYIDLLYRGPEGLVVVDYKTATTSDPEALAQRVEGYRLQGASYALTVATSTAEPVHRVTFLFLTPGGAVERDLSDLDASVADVRRLLRAGEEVMAD